jgi:hypothetical protein
MVYMNKFGRMGTLWFGQEKKIKKTSLYDELP